MARETVGLSGVFKGYGVMVDGMVRFSGGVLFGGGACGVVVVAVGRWLRWVCFEEVCHSVC